jgi:hypothetical protein
MENLSNLSTLAGLLPISGDFALRSVRFSWPEVAWAHEAGLIGWRSLTEFAKAGLDAKPGDLALAELALSFAKTRSGTVLTLNWPSIGVSFAKTPLVRDLKFVRSLHNGREPSLPESKISLPERTGGGQPSTSTEFTVSSGGRFPDVSMM